MDYKTDTYVDVGPPSAYDLSSKALLEEMEKRGLRPSGFADEDTKTLQRAFDMEWEGEREERVRQRETALLKKKQEEESMRLQRYMEKQTREEEDALSNDPDASVMLDLIHTNRAPETLILRNSSHIIRCLLKALRKNKNVKRLDLVGCNLFDEIGTEIGILLRENKTLEKLCLDHNVLGPLSCYAIAAGLKDNNTLISLSLEHNSLSCGMPMERSSATDDILDTVISTLALASAMGTLGQADAFVYPPPKRYTPDFITGSLSGSYHEQETSEFPRHRASMPTLSQGGAATLATGAARVLADTAEHNKPNYEGIRYLAEVIADHPSLRNLNLFHAGLGHMGGRYIAEAVAQNTRLTSVIVSASDGVLPNHLEMITYTCKTNRMQLVQMQQMAQEHARERWEQYEAKLQHERKKQEDDLRLEWHLREQSQRFMEKSRVEYEYLRKQRKDFADFVEIQKEKTLKKKEDELAAAARAAAKAKKAKR